MIDEEIPGAVRPSKVGARSLFRKPYSWVPYLLATLAGVVLTMGFRAALPASARISENGDYDAFYEPVARSILRGDGITLPDGSLGTRYPPGYPILLAGVYSLARATGVRETAIATVFTSACVGLAAALVLALAGEFWPRRHAWLACLLFLTYPPFLWLTKQPNSEIPFLVPLYGAILLLVVSLERGCPSAALACGVAIGVATLVRPIAIGLGLVMAAMALLLRRDVAFHTRAALAVLILFGNLLAILPWEWWLYQRTGKVIFVSTGGKKAIRDGLSFSGSRKSFRDPVVVPPGVAAIVRDVETEWDRGRLKTFGQLRSFMAAEIRQRPLEAGELLALKAARSWYATDTHRSESLVFWIQALYLALIAYGGVRTYRAGGASQRLAWVTAAVVGYFWVMTILVLSIARYMVPAVGLLMVFGPGVLGSRVAKA